MSSIKEKLFELGYSENVFPVDNKAWENILNQPTKLNPKSASYHILSQTS